MSFSIGSLPLAGEGSSTILSQTSHLSFLFYTTSQHAGTSSCAGALATDQPGANLESPASVVGVIGPGAGASVFFLDLLTNRSSL